MEVQLATGNFGEPKVKFVDVQNDEMEKTLPKLTLFQVGYFTHRIHVWYTYLLTKLPLKQIKQSW